MACWYLMICGSRLERGAQRGWSKVSLLLLLLLLLSVLSQKHLDSMRTGLLLFYYYLLLFMWKLACRSDLIPEIQRGVQTFFSLSLSLSLSAEGKLIWSCNSWKILGNFTHTTKEISFKTSSSSVQDGRGSAGVIVGWSGGGLQRGGGVFQGWSLGAEVGAKCGWLATLHREPWTAAAGLGTSCWSPYRSIPCWTVCPTRRWRSWFWGRATSGKPVRDVWRIYSAGKWSLMSCRD